MNFDQLLTFILIHWQAALLLLMLAIMTAGNRVDHYLQRRFGFSLANRWSNISLVILLVAPGVLFLAYTRPNRSFDTLPLGWLALAMLAVVAAALALHNIRNIPWKWGLATALLQTCALSLALFIGALPPMMVTALSGRIG
ncbi:hypothetical protein RugamoR57_37710 [Duganella caerulea]|uniref:hypothetical protein n=1 Tax=Duganella caerulea TaxID=2885762 RepID=UPI0030E92656